MISLVLVIVSIALGVFGFISVFNAWFIPSIDILIIIGSIVTLVYLFNLLKRYRNKRLELGLLLSALMYLSLIIGVWVNSIWKFETILSAVSMMKLTLLLAAVLFSYFFFVYVRTQSAYKRRQGNLQHEKFLKGSRFKRNMKNADGDKCLEVSLTLGEGVQDDSRSTPK